jgi:hypothetical protein
MRTDQGRHQTDIVGIKTYGKLATSCSNTQNDIVDSKKKNYYYIARTQYDIFEHYASTVCLQGKSSRIRLRGYHTIRDSLWVI